MPGFELIGREEREALNKLFDESGGVLFAHGFHERRNGIYNIREFEREFATRFKSKHATAVSSGTAALKVALKAVGIKAGDEVITQDFTFIASVEAILDVGAKPVMVRVDDSLNMCPVDLERKITPKTRAVIPVHMLGFPADIEKICSIAKHHNIAVIEDNCEATGAAFKDRPLGTWGDIGVFSFDFGKVITTGEGGMLITNNEVMGKYIREYHDHGHESNPSLPRGRDTRSIYGFNYRMTEMQGAVGRAQLKKLGYILEENAVRYSALERELKASVQMRQQFSDAQPIYDTLMFSLENKVLRERILKYLYDNGVGTKNVPDAIEWHFSGYWNHIFSQSEISEMTSTATILEKFISIPITLSRAPDTYTKVGRDILELIQKG
jgi:8-amino-3,8-dideoxy-alpha-D-manno-octulosonate transaminase